jgi:arginyl-tRNA synthetase
MNSLFDQINNTAQDAIEKSYGERFDPILKWSTKPEFGDLQINVQCRSLKNWARTLEK